jgi:hypothetical protein
VTKVEEVNLVVRDTRNEVLFPGECEVWCKILGLWWVGKRVPLLLLGLQLFAIQDQQKNRVGLVFWIARF